MLEKYLKFHTEFVNKKIEEFLPKIITENWIEENFPNTELDPITINYITKPIWELLERGGKRWRPMLMLLCCDITGGGSKIQDLISVIEIIHNGTLMVDDIEDNSDLRRGKPCTHKIFGVDVAINTGNLMYYLPFLAIKKIDLDNKTKLELQNIILDEMLKLHLGQGMDILWHNNLKINVSEEQYLQMCAFKTGTLARMSARIGALLGNASKIHIRTLAKFAESIGIAFQIQDDILNLTNHGWGKDFGEDITEGKKSLIIIKTLEKANPEDKNKLLEILNLKTKNQELIEQAIFIIKKYETIDYARQKAKNIVENAWNNLDPIIENSESKNKLKLFAEFLINRDI